MYNPTYKKGNQTTHLSNVVYEKINSFLFFENIFFGGNKTDVATKLVYYCSTYFWIGLSRIFVKAVLHLGITIFTQLVFVMRFCKTWTDENYIMYFNLSENKVEIFSVQSSPQNPDSFEFVRWISEIA